MYESINYKLSSRKDPLYILFETQILSSTDVIKWRGGGGGRGEVKAKTLHFTVSRRILLK